MYQISFHITTHESYYYFINQQTIFKLKKINQQTVVPLYFQEKCFIFLISI
uniref:Uncharacterized protein n=1 Tax=Arundo donax TaxID=35708 RepID=A0A0A9HWW3_ARUDO